METIVRVSDHVGDECLSYVITEDQAVVGVELTSERESWNTVLAHNLILLEYFDNTLNKAWLTLSTDIEATGRQQKSGGKQELL